MRAYLRPPDDESENFTLLLEGREIPTYCQSCTITEAGGKFSFYIGFHDSVYGNDAKLRERRFEDVGYVEVDVSAPLADEAIKLGHRYRVPIRIEDDKVFFQFQKAAHELFDTIEEKGYISLQEFSASSSGRRAS